MKASFLLWKKARWNGIPTLWDGEATWSLQMGPDQGGISVGRLSNYPPTERPTHSLVFRMRTLGAKEVLEGLAKAAPHFLGAQKGIGLLAEVGIIWDPFYQW